MSVLTRLLAAVVAAICIGFLVAELVSAATPERCSDMLAKYAKKCSGPGGWHPVPTQTPAATPAPGPCEPVGTKTYAEGQERMLCFTASPGGPFVEVSTQNHGNASCADFWLQMYSPSGAVSEASQGAQPGAIMQRVPGKYYIATKMHQANNAACATLTFTVR